MPTMLAAVLHDFNKLELEQIPVPKPRNHGEVVVRIKSCGICATDYKAIKGIRTNLTFPYIAGHEPSGIVAEIGPGVSHVKVGDEVIVQPLGYCGYCNNCRTNNTHYCGLRDRRGWSRRCLAGCFRGVYAHSRYLPLSEACQGLL